MPRLSLPIRVARPAPRGWHVAKTVLQTAIIWSLALWVVPHLIHRAELAWGVPGFAPPRGSGWLLFSVASCLGLWSGWTMAWRGEGPPLPLDTARKLVIAGPYRWVRNPMAVAGLAQGFAVGLLLGSYPILAYALAGGLIWQVLVRPIEEADLTRRFGEPYLGYCHQVRCWRPRWPR